MRNILKRALALAAVTALLAAPMAQATNGYFKIGAGAKNRGMAGAGIAYGQDPMAAAINPASIAEVEDSVVAGVEIFKPKRKGQVDATGMLVPDLGGAGPRQGAYSNEQSRSNVFFIPSFGITKAWSNKITLGMSVAGNGGMNTRYGNADTGNGNIYVDAFAPVIGDTATSTFQPGPSGFAGLLTLPPPNGFGVPTAVVDGQLPSLYLNPNNTPALGINLAQVLISPTLTYKITPNHAIGFGPVIGYQSFRSYGLGLFQGFSSDPGKVTNNGNDDALGVGGQIGYQGHMGMFSFGLMGRSKIYMDEFDDYSGLFAEQGDFDIPAMFGGGIALHFGSKLTVAVDVSRIMYSDVKAINNDGPTANEFFGAFVGALTGNPAAVSNPLGTNDGWGFGWDDATVYKIGVNYAYSPTWTFRAGFNYSEIPYDDDQALFNVLAPATVEKHATVGFTYMVNPDTDFSMTYMHAFRNDVDNTYTGSGPFTGFSYGAKNDMYQNAIEAAFSWKF
ncbi:OmpP1/FadL family transporter [Pseudomonadota bacterium]